MTKFALPALAAALALGACADPDADGENTETVVTQPAADETTVIRETEVVPVDTTDPVVIEEDDGSSLTVDGGDVDATIDEDGVDAEIDLDGN